MALSFYDYLHSRSSRSRNCRIVLHRAKEDLHRHQKYDTGIRELNLGEIERDIVRVVKQTKQLGIDYYNQKELCRVYHLQRAWLP